MDTAIPDEDKASRCLETSRHGVTETNSKDGRWWPAADERLDHDEGCYARTQVERWWMCDESLHEGESLIELCSQLPLCVFVDF